ncbi:histidinol-phosphate aminotransferase [Spirochaetia bacterium]|nr:histidinol-phosphate aminotransferase [Spirochaetia bacterium]
MSEFWNTKTRSLTPYVPGEQPQNKKFVKLNTNENPYPPAPVVLRTIRKAVDQSIRLYPDPESAELRQLIAEKYAVKPEQVFVGNGSDEVLSMAFAAFFESASTEDGTAPLPVLFPDVTYSFYPVFADLWGVPYETPAVQKDFTIDIKDYRRRAGGVVLANPNTPTGLLLPLTEVRAILKYHEKYNKVVILDQAYAPFSKGGTKAVPALIERYPNLLTVHTLSKSSSLAGMRIGFAIGNAKLIEGLCRIRDSFNSYTLDRLAQAAGAAAISASRYFKGTAKKIIATRERISADLKNAGIDVLPSEANFIFIRIPKVDGAKVYAALKKKGILVRHFNKPQTADYVRVSIGIDEEMDRFVAECAAIKSAVK